MKMVERWSDEKKFQLVYPKQITQTEQYYLSRDAYAAHLLSIKNVKEAGRLIYASLENLALMNSGNYSTGIKYHKSGIIKLNDHKESGFIAQQLQLIGVYDKVIDYFAVESSRNHLNLYLFSQFLICYFTSVSFSDEELLNFKNKIDNARNVMNHEMKEYFETKDKQYHWVHVHCCETFENMITMIEKERKRLKSRKDVTSYKFNYKVQKKAF
eukprot:gene4070-7359_t